MAESEPITSIDSPQDPTGITELPCCHVCGTQLALKGPPSKRRFSPICPNCGAKCQLRCSWCKALFEPTKYRLGSGDHFCSDQHANNFRNKQRSERISAERAARRAIPKQCARKGSIYAPGVRENPELLKDCTVIFTPRRNGQDFCSRECQRIQWWIENYDELSGKVKDKSRRQYEKRVATVAEAERILAQRTPEEVTEAARITLAACLQIEGISKRAMRHDLFPKQNMVERRYDDVKQFFRRKGSQIQAEVARLGRLPRRAREAAILSARSHL